MKNTTFLPILGVFAAIALIAAPVSAEARSAPVSAAVIAELQAQIQILLDKVEALRQASVSSPTTPTIEPLPTPKSAVPSAPTTHTIEPLPAPKSSFSAVPIWSPEPIPAPQRSIILDEVPGSPYISCTLPTLSFGARDNSVYLLQMVLKQSGHYPEGFITGYYGRLTRNAVGNFQKANGLAANDGQVDSVTASVLNTLVPKYFSECGQPKTISPVIKNIVPSYGPIGTQITLTGYGFTTNSINTVQFGAGYLTVKSYDGASLQFSVPDGLDFCKPGSVICPQAFAQVLPGKYNVSVENANGVSNKVEFVVISKDDKRPAPLISYLSPSSGPVGALVTVYGSGFTSVDNIVMLDGGLVGRRFESDGNTIRFAVPSSANPPCITAPNPCLFSAAPVMLVNPGPHKISVQNANGTSNTAIFVVTEVKPGQNLPPVISGVSGPTELKVNEVGTWTVKAYDPDGAYLSYSVNWGDQTGIAVPQRQSVNGQAVLQEATFTHTYSSAGRYSVVFNVSDAKGAVTQSSITVNVVGVSPNRAPDIGEIGVPALVQPGQVVTFAFSAVDPDGDNLAWSVGWGDGTTEAQTCSAPPLVTIPFTAEVVKSSTFTPTHTWSKTGQYRVRVEANDCRGGSDSVTFVINVGETTPVITPAFHLTFDDTLVDAKNGRQPLIGEPGGIEYGTGLKGKAAKFKWGSSFAQYSCPGVFNQYSGTVEALVKFDQFTPRDAVIWHTDDSRYVLYYDYYSRGDYKSISARAGGEAYSANYSFDQITPPRNVLTAGGWHHLVMTWSGSPYGTVKIYVDGVLKDTRQYAESGSCSTFRVGNNYWPGLNWGDGWIDELKVYQTVLSDQDVAKAYLDYFSPVVLPPLPPLPLSTDNLIVNTPLANQSVSNPIVIKGKARNIFFEGEFAVKLLGYDYPLGHPNYAESSRVITSTYARIIGDCDGIRNQWCDFEATINHPSSGTGVENMLYFYSGGQGDPGTPAAPKFVAALPIKLK